MRSDISYTYYGPFKLKDLRQIVEETQHVTEEESVSVHVTPGDRPWESESARIEIG